MWHLLAQSRTRYRIGGGHLAAGHRGDSRRPDCLYSARLSKLPAVGATNYDHPLDGPWSDQRISSNRKRFARSSAGRARTFLHRSRNDWVCRSKDIEDCYAWIPPVGLEWVGVVLAIRSGLDCRRNAKVIPTAGFITRIFSLLGLDRRHFPTCIGSFADSSEIRRIGAAVSIVRG